MPAKDVKLTGSWIANDDTKYTVKYYYSDANGEYNETYPTATQPITRTGTTDTVAVVSDADKEPEWPGYTLDESQNLAWSGVILGDGSLILKVYFKFDAEPGNITVNKTWIAPAGTSLPEATIHLMQSTGAAETELKNGTFGDVQLAAGQTILVEEPVTFTNVPRYAPFGVTYDYVVTEDALSGYTVNNDGRLTVEVEGSVHFTNTKDSGDTPETPEKTANIVTPFVENGVEMAMPGEVITYTIKATNHLNTAAILTITDKLDPNVEFVNASEGFMIEGDVVTWTISDVPAFETREVTLQVKVKDNATVTQVENTAVVQVNNGVETASEPVVTTIAQPGLQVEKSVTNSGPFDLENEIAYRVVVKNIGNIALSDIEVTDALAPILNTTSEQVATYDGAGTWTIDALAVGAEATITYTYTVVEADILKKSILNTAFVSADDPRDPENKITTSDDEETALKDPNGHLKVTKVTTSEPRNGESYELGETITYEITVLNNGNLTITDIDVTDTLAKDEKTYPEQVIGHIDSLAPNTSQTFEFSYKVTEADILAGSVVNKATATGTSPDPDVPEVPVDEGETKDETEDLDATLTVTKTSDVAEGATVGLGETINYTITVTNDGNVPYTGVKVVDDLAGLVIAENERYTVNEDGTVEVGDLAVGETVTITASYVVTSEDIKAGYVLNTATAGADPIDDPKDPENPKQPDGEDDVTIETDDLNATLTVVKTSDVAEGEVAKIGQTIHYTITVTNEGNVPYTGVTVIDELAGLVIDANERYTVAEDGTITVGDLAVGEIVTITASYTVTEEDLLVGTVVNTATASGDPVDDPKHPETPATPAGGDENEVTLAVDVPVTVHWVDGDQFYRPTTVMTVQLIGNDDVVMNEVEVDPTTMGTDWTYTFENMPTHDENGELIVYTVHQAEEPGNGRYDVAYNELEVTNTAYVTVTFVDWNGAVLQNQRLLIGESGAAPESPRRVGYNFTQWDGGSWENVTRDQIIRANYRAVYEAINELNIPLAGGTIQNVGDCFD